MEDELKRGLLDVSSEFVRATGRKPTGVWNSAVRDARFMARLDSGQTFTVKTYDRALRVVLRPLARKSEMAKTRPAASKSRGMSQAALQSPPIERRRDANREARVQASVVAWLHWVCPGVIVYAIPNGGLRSKSEAARMEMDGHSKRHAGFGPRPARRPSWVFRG